MSLGRLLLIFSVLLAVSCGGGGGSSPPPAELGFAAPTLVEVSAAGSSSIDASWLPADDGTTPAGAMRYQVHASTLPDYLPGEATLKQEVVGAYSTRLTGLSPGTAYTVIIVAINAGGLTRASLPLTVRTAETISETLPGAVVVVALEDTIASVSDGQVVLQPGAPAPQIGQFIASTAGDGFLRRVIRVEDAPSGPVVYTEPAALNEVFRQVEISSAFSMVSVPQEVVPEGSGIVALSLGAGGKGTEWKWPGTRFSLASSPVSRVASKSTSNSDARPAPRRAAAKSAIGNTLDASPQLSQAVGNWATFSGPQLIGILQGTRGSVDLDLAVTRDDVKRNGTRIPVALCKVVLDPEESGAPELLLLGEFQHLESEMVDGYAAVRRALQHVSLDATGLAARVKPYRYTLRAYVDEADNRCQGSFRFFTGWKEILEIEVAVAVVSTPDFPRAETKSLTFTGGFNVRNDVDFTFDPSLHVDVRLNERGRVVPSIEYARLEARGRAELSQRFTVTATGAASLDVTKPLIDSRQFVKVYMAGQIPIVMAGEFSADLRLQGNVTGAVTLGEEIRYALEDMRYGLVYENGVWQTTRNVQPTWQVKVHGEGDAEANLTLTFLPKLSVRFYEVASGRLVLAPYLQADAGVYGRVLADATPSGLTTDADYWLTKGRLAGGIDAYVMADLSIWEKTLLKWPGNARIDDYTSYRRIPILQDSSAVIAGLPELTATLSESATHPADSRAVLVRGRATDVPNPFRALIGGPASFLPFVAWTAPRVIAPSGAAWSVLPSLAGDQPGDVWVSLSAPATYTVRLGGNSSMGGWARQVAEVVVDAGDRNANGIADNWENRFSLVGTGPAIAEGDPDGDGFTNLEEFRTGRNPLVADTELPPPPTQTVAITQVLDDVGPETGLVPEGGVTDDTQPEIRGTLSAVLGSGQALKVYGNLVEIGTASVAGTNWTFWPVGLQQGDHIFTAAVVDARGQRGPVADGWLIRVTSDAPSGFSPLNDTGIDWCADASTNFVDCLAASIFPGQDAHYGRDAKAAAGTLAKTGGGHAGFDFTKLGSNGQPLSIQNAAWNEAGSEAAGTKWSCVKDNNTKLVWEMKLGGTAGLHHKDNTYTWYNTDATSNGGFAGYVNGGTCTGSNCDTQALVAAVNAQGWCGANDWRMPTMRELENIVDLSRYSPSIDTNYFPNTQSDWFWSSSPYAGSSSYAWYVNFGNGDASGYYKGYDGRVRLVRAGQ